MRLLSNSRTKGMRKLILIADVSRAFFEAPMHRKVAVELPKEALSKEEEASDLVGILDMSLYGTRDAAVNFQKEVGNLMQSLGFKTSKSNPSLFCHPKDGIKVRVHGDDFVASGERGRIMAFKEQLARGFTIKSKVVGLGSPYVAYSGAALGG